MCGIVGFTNFSQDSFNNIEVLEAMNNSIEHRGPDEAGIYSQDEIFLGHRRLSIVDLSSGKQPMKSSDGNLTIVFNGEIYNYKELQEELKKDGFKFETDSDTEVILNLYRKYHLDFVKHLNGMFAFAIWDKNDENLIMARDRMGEKPLFYQINKHDVIFASELKALVKHPAANKQISKEGLNKFLTYEYIPSPYTILDNVWKLEAGQMIVVKKDSVKKHFYWQYPSIDFIDGEVNSDKKQIISELDDLLRDSIRMRLQADVPVGVLLSGGIDSSLVTAIASQVKTSKEKIKSFSIYFDEKSYDESAHIKRIVNNFDLDHHSQLVRSADMLEIIPKLGSIMDEPMADPSIVPTYYLSKMTSSKVKTVLGGDGADELFAGYPTYTANKLVNIYNIIPFELRTPLTKLIKFAQGSVLPVSGKNIALDFKLKQFFRGTGIASEIRFFRWMGGFLDIEKKDILSDKFRTSILGQLTYEDINRYLSRVNINSELNRLLYLSQKLYLADDILVKTDRAAMQNSLEIRAPFLDHRLVEYAAGLHERFKLRRFSQKYILKKLSEKYLPKENIYRPKKGFGVPITQWLKDDLKEPMLDLLSKDRLDRQGIFNYDGVKDVIDDHIEGKTNNRKQLWSLMSLQLWMDEFKIGI